MIIQNLYRDIVGIGTSLIIIRGNLGWVLLFLYPMSYLFSIFCSILLRYCVPQLLPAPVKENRQKETGTCWEVLLECCRLCPVSCRTQ